MDTSTIDLADVVTAYRKAKFDLFYASDPRRGDIVVYEESLATNLSDLLSRITSEDEAWASMPAFVGGFTFAPKQLKEPEVDGTSFWSVPSESWRRQTAQAPEAPVANFRLMAYCSIDFHVFSTVWMLEVGTYLDSLLADSAMGSRLRRSPDGGPNQLGSGTFLPYQGGYQKWRDGGLKAMTDALANQIDVIALTADVTSFYHQLDPGFMLDDAFLHGVLNANLSPFQRKLTRLFVAALRAWSGVVSAETGWQDRGLPVGLPASAVIANLALAELDLAFNEHLEPLYYGRYVDDVLLVLADPGDVSDLTSLWRWIVERSRGLLSIGQSPFQPLEPDTPDNAVKFNPPYLDASQVVFENAKNKTFHLSGPSGMSVIDAIRNTIRERDSEWRSLVNVPGDVEQIAPAITAARRIDGDSAATLRDADQVSARKLSFAVRLRDFESFERNLPPDAWSSQRSEFFRVTCEQVLSLPTFFELAKYLPRLVALAAACGDTHALSMLFSALSKLPAEVRETCDVEVAAYLVRPRLVGAGPSIRDRRSAALVIQRWTGHLVDQAVEYLAAGWRGKIKAADLAGILTPLTPLATAGNRTLPSAASLLNQHRRFAQRDLAHRPYRWTVLAHTTGERVRAGQPVDVPLHPALSDGLDLLVDLLRRRPGRSPQALELPGSSNPGLAFATRPPSAMELYATLPRSGKDEYGVADGVAVSRILHATRGYFGGPSVSVERRRAWPTVVNVANRTPARPVRIALTMLETRDSDLFAAATGSPRLTIERLNDMRRLLSSVANHREKPDYVLLPELAMPAEWFNEFARGLRRSGISLVSGIEYQKRGRQGVVNQVWAALRLDGWGLPFYLHKQDKQRPAKPELEKVLSPAKKELVPDQTWLNPPVIAHGEFRFALLICSELTNIAYRNHLRGAVDALLVPEWNQDLHSFEAVVEAAALDLHAYIGQANTRGYGDSRLRAPMYREWDRDVVRLKGGLHDYFVVGHVDVDTLRAFQSAGGGLKVAEPTKELKPLPDGFKLDPQRKS